MKTLKRFLVVAMSMCMTIGLLTVPINASETSPITAEDIEEYINNPENAERVKQGICYVDTRGASDEYYECGAANIDYSEDEVEITTQSEGQVYYALGKMVQWTLTATGWAFTGAGIAWSVITRYTIRQAGLYNRVVTYYGRPGSMTCTVYDAMGNFRRYANYSGIIFQVRKVYNYNYLG